MWVDQGSRVLRFNPTKHVSTHWMGSPKSWSGRRFGIHLPALARATRSSLRHLWRSSILSAITLGHWDMSPGIWWAVLANRTWLWQLCHPRRELTRRGGKSKACPWHTDWIGRGNLFHPGISQPACNKQMWLFGRTIRTSDSSGRKVWFCQGTREN
jgi:hypothetical protein